MKVRVDPDLCVGHGRCYVLAPDVFGPTTSGTARSSSTDVDGALAEQARIGAENCPERAITVGGLTREPWTCSATRASG